MQGRLLPKFQGLYQSFPGKNWDQEFKLIKDFKINFIELMLIVNLTIVISICGDLLESFFKRKNNIKDSSKYLPGHGGFFDRFDSFIASIIMLTVFSLL